MKCTECKGTGEIEVHSQMLMCPECFGKGEIKGKEPISNTSETPEINELGNRLTAISNAIVTMITYAPGFKATIYKLTQMRDEIDQQLKDAQFDQETNPLPFPEK